MPTKTNSLTAVEQRVVKAIVAGESQDQVAALITDAIGHHVYYEVVVDYLLDIIGVLAAGRTYRRNRDPLEHWTTSRP